MKDLGDICIDIIEKTLYVLGPLSLGAGIYLSIAEKNPGYILLGLGTCSSFVTTGYTLRKSQEHDFFK